MIGALIGAGISIAGSLYGQSRAKAAQKDYDAYAQNAIKKQRDNLKGRYTDLEATFNRRNSQDYLDTEAAKSMQKRFNDYAKTTRESIQGQAIAGGATTEASVAEQRGVGETYNNMLDSLAAKSTEYKLRNQNSYDAQKMGLRNSEDAINEKEDAISLARIGAKIESGNNLASNLSGAGAAIGNASAEGAYDGLFKSGGNTIGNAGAFAKLIKKKRGIPGVSSAFGDSVGKGG